MGILARVGHCRSRALLRQLLRLPPGAEESLDALRLSHQMGKIVSFLILVKRASGFLPVLSAPSLSFLHAAKKAQLRTEAARGFAATSARRKVPVVALRPPAFSAIEHVESRNSIMNGPITRPRAAGMLVAVLALAAATPALAQRMYSYGSGYYGYGPPVYGYGPRVYGYGPRYYGYRRGFEQDPNNLPVGTGAWWRAMDRANRGGNVGGSGSR